MNKVGSYWFSQRANKEINSVGDDINVWFLFSSEPSCNSHFKSFSSLYSIKILLEVCFYLQSAGTAPSVCSLLDPFLFLRELFGLAVLKPL